MSMDDYYEQLDEAIRRKRGAPKKSLKPGTSRTDRLARCVIRLTFVTEMGRMVRDCIKEPAQREKLYWSVIQSIDFSDEWHDRMSKKTLDKILNMLLSGDWDDIKTAEVTIDEPTGESGEPQEVL